MSARSYLAPLTVVIAFASLPAHAELTDCSGIDSADSKAFKIVLDEFDFATAAGQSETDVRNRLKSLRRQLSDELANVQLTAPFVVILCEGRRPSGGGTDFTKDRARRLNSQKVSLEMWGFVDRTAEAGQPPRVRTDVEYLIVPLRYHHYDSPDVQSLYATRYPKADTAHPSDAMLEPWPEIQVFAFTGAGLQAAANQEHLRAMKLFKSAEDLLVGTAQDAGSPWVASMLTYLRQQYCNARAELEPDPTYRNLFSFSANNTCPRP